MAINNLEYFKKRLKECEECFFELGTDEYIENEFYIDYLKEKINELENDKMEKIKEWLKSSIIGEENGK